MIALRKAVAIAFAIQFLSACAGGSGEGRTSPLLPQPARVVSGAQARPAYSKGLLALYSFNGTLHDASGNGHTAKDSATPTYVKGAPFGGKAIAFDGSGMAIVTAPLNISVSKIPQLTMGGWFRATTIGSPPYGIVSNDNGDFDRSLDIDDRDAKAGTNWSAFVGGKVVGKVPVHTGKWVFAAVAYNQATLPGKYVLYVNDGSRTTVLKGKANFDDSSVTTGVTIGRNPNFDAPFAGDAANVFFYVGILSSKQLGKIIAHGPSQIP